MDIYSFENGRYIEYDVAALRNEDVPKILQEKYKVIQTWGDDALSVTCYVSTGESDGKYFLVTELRGDFFGVWYDDLVSLLQDLPARLAAVQSHRSLA